MARDGDKERSDYRGDVIYDVWRRGGNVDHVDYDRVSDHFYHGDSPDYAASHEMRLQRPQEPEPMQSEEEYWGDQYPDGAEDSEPENVPPAAPSSDTKSDVEAARNNEKGN